MKKAHRLILIALILALILILLVVNSVSLFHAEYYIFADIHDFPSIMEESPEDITINQYDSPEKITNFKFMHTNLKVRRMPESILKTPPAKKVSGTRTFWNPVV